MPRKNKTPLILFLISFLALLTSVISPALCMAKKLNVGVTLHPYYSWVANIAGDTVNLNTIIPENSDPHSYQVRPNDLANLEKLDCIVVNTLGHDDYIDSMLKAAKKDDIFKIKPNEGLPLIADVHKKFKFQEKDKSVSYNSHTYVSLLGAIQQINNITEALAKLQPEHADLYKKNARNYSKKLRAMLRSTLKVLDKEKAEKLSIATVHDGYAYMFQELGVTVDAVIQPRHGIEPSARQLADTINRIKKASVKILFTEVDYKKKYVDTIFQETGCRVYKLSHISNGSYGAEKFEQDMQANLDTLVKAVMNQ